MHLVILIEWFSSLSKNLKRLPTKYIQLVDYLEILCESSGSEVLFIEARLFDDGNLYVITAYWANEGLIQIYYQESEVLRDE